MRCKCLCVSIGFCVILSLQITDTFVFEENGCQDGAQCYHWFCYKYLEKVNIVNVSGTECIQDTNNRSSSLVSIHSWQENEFVAAMLKYHNSSQDIWTSGYCRSFQPENITSNCHWLVNDEQLMQMNYTSDIDYDDLLINKSVTFLLTNETGHKKWRACKPNETEMMPSICKWRQQSTALQCQNQPDVNWDLDTTTLTTWEISITHSIATPSTTVPGTSYCDSTQCEGISWPQTSGGQMAIQPCPPGSSGFATWFCNESLLTYQPPGEPNLTGCKHDWVIDIESTIHGGNYSAVGVIFTIWMGISLSPALYVLDVIETQEILANILGNMHRTSPNVSPMTIHEVAVMTVKICSQTLHDKHMKTWHQMESALKSTTANLITENVESAGFLLTDGFTNLSISISEEYVDMNVQRHNPDFYANSSRRMDMKDYGISIIFPKNFQYIKQEVDNDVRIVVAAFRNLEKLLVGNMSEKSSFSLNSRVVGVSFGHMTTEISFPDDELQLYFSTMDTSIKGQPVCSYWNITKEYPNGNWHMKGCSLVEFDDNITKCSCDHLTNFAVLLDINGVINHLSPKSQRALEILTVIGVSLSVVCLMLSIAGFHLCRSLHGIRTSVTKNLCICLLVGDIFMLFGLDRTNNKVVCAAIASILVFSFTSSFFWMLTEGIHLYLLLKRVFQPRTSPLRWYYLASYGIPALILFLGLGINHTAYGTENYCWLDTSSSMIWSFAGPVAAVITMNIIFLALALYTSWQASQKRRMSLSKNIRQWIRGSLSLTSVLGVTWIFGFFYLDTTTQLFAYVFTILNSLQGCLIFGFHCILNEHTRQALLRSLSRCESYAKCKPEYKRKRKSQTAINVVCSNVVNKNVEWPAVVSTPSTSSTSEIHDVQNQLSH